MPSDEYIDKIVNNINDGKYNKKELENLYANAERKGVEKVKKAIDRQARKAVSSEPDLKEIDFSNNYKMKLAIVGNTKKSENSYYLDYNDFCKKLSFVINSGLYDTIITGGTEGVGIFAKQFAEENFLNYIEFKPDYKKYGKKQGNAIWHQQIVDAADRLIGFIAYESSSADTYSAKLEKTVKLAFRSKASDTYPAIWLASRQKKLLKWEMFFPQPATLEEEAELEDLTK